MTRPTVRDDLGLLEGYHSPQVDVEVRLNTNEAPEPPPPEFARALAEATAAIDFHRYPDRSAGRLRDALARRYGRRPDEVFAANGSNEVLQTLLLTFGGPGRTAVTFEPTYALHGHLSRITGTSVVEGERGEDFALDPTEARRVIDAARPHVVFLCSPNNPTGLVDPAEVVHSVAEAAAEHAALVIVDEAYGQFAAWSAVELLDDELPLVVSRTFSKTWSMAALRLGYLLAPSWVVDELEKVVLPYHLDAVKQLAGELALTHADAMEQRVAAIVAERERLVLGLRGLPVRVWPSGANFVLFRPEEHSGDEVWQGLLDRSILVRNCASWPRLAGCLRVTIGTPTENDRFLSALEEVLA